MTTTLKNCISLDNLQSQNLLNSGWSCGDEVSTGPHFKFSVPLKHLLMLTNNLGDVFEQTINDQTFIQILTAMYCSHQYLSIDPKKSLPDRRLRRLCPNCGRQGRL